MRIRQWTFGIGAWLLCATAGPGMAQQDGSQAAQPLSESLLVLRQTTRSEGGMTGGSSRSGGAMVERVLERRGDGLVIEYDNPKKPRRPMWQLPVRVLDRPGTATALLDEAAVEARIEAYLVENPRLWPYCGQTIFTWTAISIDCEPEAALEMVEPYDLRPGPLAEGMPYAEADATGPVPLEALPAEDGNRLLSARLTIDPDTLRAEDLEMLVQVARIVGRGPRTIEAAAEQESATRYAGERTVTFTIADDGTVLRRSSVTVVDIERADARGTERREMERTVERQDMPEDA